MTQNRKIGRIYIITGIVLALVTTLATVSLISSRVAPPPPPTSNVIFTTVAMQAGTGMSDALNATINPADACPDAEVKSIAIGALQVCKVPIGYLPITAITLNGLTDDAIENNPDMVRLALMAELADWSTVIDLQRSEIVQRNQLNNEKGLPSDRRAVSIRVTQETGVDNALRPGQRVDVVASYSIPTELGRDTEVSEVLLQNIEVLAISGPLNPDFGTSSLAEEDVSVDTTLPDQALIPPQQEFRELRVVTLSLSLEESIQLTYMTNFGREVRLLARRGDDQEILDVDPVTTDSFKK